MAEDAVPAEDLLDRGGFEQLYDRHYPIILNYTMRRLLNMADAEDVTAETFTRALANFHRLEAEPKVWQAWLFRTATNLVHDRYRRGRQRKEITLETDDERMGSPETWLADTGLSASEQLERFERYQRLHALIARLRPKYQDVLVLRFMEEKSLREIAEILETRVGTVKWRLHVALKKFGSLARKDDGLRRSPVGSGGRES